MIFNKKNNNPENEEKNYNSITESDNQDSVVDDLNFNTSEHNSQVSSSEFCTSFNSDDFLIDANVSEINDSRSKGNSFTPPKDKRRRNSSRNSSRNSEKKENTKKEFVERDNSHKFFEYTCTDIEEGIDAALEYFPIEDRYLIGHEVLEEGEKRFKLFGAREIKYKFFIKPIYKSLLLPFLTQLIKKANLELYVKVSFKAPNLRVSFSGKDKRLLLRNDYELIKSFEHLIRIYLYKRVVLHDGIRFFVRIDKSKNRASDEELEKLAKETQEKVIASGESIVLKSMDPSERRVIHYTLQDNKDVKTTSLGEGRFKRVEVSLKES